MRIQFCSDLHLEINEQREFPDLLEPVAPILALLGDIGDPESTNLEIFLEWCCRYWSQVLYVPGNHEFWLLKPETKKTIDSVVARFREFERKYKNFKFCWRQKLQSEDGIIILATPLWSRPAEGLEVSADIERHNTKAWVDRDRSFDAKTLNTLHEADLKWLERELRLAKHKLVVVLTHYAPSLLLIDSRNLHHPDEILYASELDGLLRPPIVAWACGHTHQSVQWTKEWETATGDSGTVLIITNPYGYKNENLYYRKEYVLRIDPTMANGLDEDECLAGMTYKSLQ